MTAQTVLLARLTRISERLVTDATKGEKPLSKRKHRQLKRRFNVALAEMTLESYVLWINRGADGFELMGANDWRAQGVTTAVELGRILDAETRRAIEKDSRYD